MRTRIVAWVVALPLSVSLAASLAAKPKSPKVAPVVRVEGDYCPKAEQPCLRWLPNPEEVTSRQLLRCAEFGPTVCKSAKTQPIAFYIDRYEYPGREHEIPVVRVTWVQAARHCARAGKRLCTEEEWTLACEGEKLLPYPYGYARDSTACNIDADLSVPANRGSGEHWRSPIDRREPAGTRPKCVSSFGVYDMTGNVDEWVDGTAQGHAASSMGGYWGPVRNRCRAVTRAHDESFSFYQTGFRCCKDAR